MSFVPYQVDYTVKNVSKTLGFSKKKVAFKFGIANPKSIREGRTGVACRGSEHEIVFTWSLSSGKRQLLVDGKESHYSESGQNGWVSDRTWQHMFDVKVPGMGKFRAMFVSQPVQKEVPGSKPFDLRVAGVSYFAFNQLFQLGTPQMVVRGTPRAQMYGNDEPMSPEERRQVAQARLESLRDLAEKEERDKQKKQQAAVTRAAPTNPNESLISFDTPVPAAPLATAPAPVSAQPNMAFASTNTSVGSMPYGQNPYAPQAQPNPFSPTGGPPQQQQQQGLGFPSPPAAAPAGGMVPYGQSSALTSYMPPAGQPAPSPYALPTGGAPPPQQNPFGFASPGGGAPPTPLSPETTTPSVYSYGSAPTFAQPPSQQTPQFAMQQQSPPPQQYMQQQPNQQQPYGQPGVPPYNPPYQQAAYNVAPQF